MKQFITCKLRRVLAILTLAAVLILCAGIQSSEAIFTLKLSDGITDIIVVEDNLQGDSLGVDGAIIYNGPVGMFDLSVTTAISKPIIGSASNPQLYLSSVGVSSNSNLGGMLTITLSDSNYDAYSTTGFLSYIGGVSAGVVTMNNYMSESNELFDMDTNIGSYVSSHQNNFSGSASFDIIPTKTFSLTTEVKVTHGSGTFISSFSSHLKPGEPYTAPPYTAAPEPVSSLLFITGGALMAGRRFRNSCKAKLSGAAYSAEVATSATKAG